jgi:proteasome lid subunit RPN8/RPN11
MLRHAEQSYPEECVGALFARDGVLVASLALENAAVDRRRSFELSAREYLRAEAEAERLGATLYGFYHSHPDAPSTPSAHDRASWFPLLSFSVRNGKADPRSMNFSKPAIARSGERSPHTQ